MNKTSKAFFKAAAIFQLLTAAIHSISLFVKPVPANDTEKQLVDLMNTYHMEAGAGFAPTFSDLFTSMSACFSLLLLFGGMINLFVLKKTFDATLLKGILNINLLVFTIVFVLMCAFTFLPPIICTGLIWLCLAVSRLSFK